MQPVAIRLLSESRAAQLPLSYQRRRQYIRRLRGILGFKAWPQDILRHTCASYWLEASRDEAFVAYQLGTSAAMLNRHYRELVLPEDARRYWD